MGMTVEGVLFYGICETEPGQWVVNRKKGDEWDLCELEEMSARVSCLGCEIGFVNSYSSPMYFIAAKASIRRVDYRDCASIDGLLNVATPNEWRQNVVDAAVMVIGMNLSGTASWHIGCFWGC